MENQGKYIGKVTPEQVEKAFSDSKIPQKIYVGPNLLGLPTYTVVETELTDHIKRFVEKCGEIEKLFVPISEMANIEKRIKEKGTLEHRYYQKIMQYKNHGGEK